MTKTDTYEKVVQHLETYQQIMRDPSGNNGFFCLGLHYPQHIENIGSALRAAGCFGAALLAIMGAKYKKVGTDVHHQYRRMPLLVVDDLKNVVPYHCVPVAVEMVEGATSLTDYEHPLRAFYVFGGEHETMGQKVLSWCRDVVSIPTNGSLNLAACINVVLYDRLAKSLKKAEKAVHAD